MNDQATAPREMWAIVELMGHQKIAGHLTEETFAGGAFLRVDVPATAAQPAFSKFYGDKAVYCITPVSEDLARAAAEGMRPRAVEQWELPRLPGPDESDGEQ